MAAGDVIYASDADQVLSEWESYTPVWSVSSGTPSPGTTGSLTGRYKKIGRTVLAQVMLVFGGTGISGGTSGGWSFSLPVTAAAVANITWLGTYYGRDDSAGGGGNYNGMCSIGSGSGAMSMFEASTHAQVSPTNPFAPAANDYVVCEIEYEAAS